MRTPCTHNDWFIRDPVHVYDKGPFFMSCCFLQFLEIHVVFKSCLTVLLQTDTEPLPSRGWSCRV